MTDDSGNPSDLNDALDIQELDYNQINPDSLLVEDEADISGSAPDPESDDDVLANAQEVGIGIDDPEIVRELDIAGDVELAEKLRRGID